MLIMSTRTSHSAVAERPHDALCPSVVSFNSVICRAEDYCYLVFRFTTVYN